MLKWAFVTLAIALPNSASAQKPSEFDVATLKRSPPPSGNTININLGVARNGKVSLTNATLSDCIKFAYSLASDAQLSGPEWINSGTLRYDVVAEASAGTPRDQLLVMLQTLLADRMKLILRREQKELRYVALIPAKSGPKMPMAKTDTGSSGPVFGGRIASPEMSMFTLAKLLSRFERETIFDMTGLPGLYEVHLEWSMDQTGQDTTKPAGPSLSTAIQEQLGLKLEARKGQVEILVVDSAEKIPAEN
jgi:uncharacterized protein (TIGR03435 family)